MNKQFNTLFIAKEKQSNQLSILVQRQMKALGTTNNSLQIEQNVCKGTGIPGYISIYKNLKKFLRQKDFDLIHAHYSLIGTITLLARKKEKVVVSFMGSDVYFNGFIFKFARWFVLKKADHIIVKSDTLLKKLPQQKNISVIPNGINMELFRPVDKAKAKEEVGWNQDKVHILFPAGKNRYEKNYPLAEQAITELGKKYPVALHLLEHIAPDEVPIFLNAADIVLLTSRWEGSSNVTKEAMACNTVVVSTDVGDAGELFRNLAGYFTTNHSVEDVVVKLEQAVAFCKENSSTQGRQRILDAGLDDATMAKKLYKVYMQISDTRNE